MAVTLTRPSPLRTAAAIILGGVIGFIVFLLFALVIAAVNDLMGMNIPFTLRADENAWSAGLLILFIGLSIAGVYWKELTTPPEEPEGPAAELPEDEETD
ncbi:MAG TPA: hypothetical protein VEI81_04000 [Methanoregula sp.]|nr:hypothetical protein [Methanoregula sp.]